MKIMINKLNINLDKLLLDLEKKSQKMDHKIMYDKEGRGMIVRLFHDYTFDSDFDRVTLFISYLDDFTLRVYKPCMFSLYSKNTSIEMYRLCMENNEYEEYTLIFNEEDN